MIEQALRDYLVSKTDITNDVGRAIYEGRRPNDAPAFCVTIQQSRASDREYDLGAEDSHFRPIVEIEVFGRGQLASRRVRTIADNIRKRISGYVGTMGTVTVDNVTITADGWTDPDIPQDGSDKWYFRWAIDAEIVYQPARPDFT